MEPKNVSVLVDLVLFTSLLFKLAVGEPDGLPFN